MKELYIYHHLGLGDHIICNAIVRNYAKDNDKIYLFVKPHNYKNVAFMYRDLKNLTLISIFDDFEIFKYLQMNQINLYNVIKIGSFGSNWGNNFNITFDKNFYLQVGIPFEKRWDSFF